MLTLKQAVSLYPPQHTGITEGPLLLEGRTYHSEAKNSSYHSRSTLILSKPQHHRVNRIHLKLGRTKRRQETILLRQNHIRKVAPYRNLQAPKLRKTTPDQWEMIICAQLQTLLLADRYRHPRPSYSQNSRSHLKRHSCRDTNPREVKVSDCRMLLKTERRLQAVPLLELIPAPVLLNNEVHR